jgi:hypothetical protein
MASIHLPRIPDTMHYANAHRSQTKASRNAQRDAKHQAQPDNEVQSDTLTEDDVRTVYEGIKAAASAQGETVLWGN